MILDIIIVAIVVIMFIIGYKRGIAKTLFNLIALVLSGVIGSFLANVIAKAVYANCMSPQVTEGITKSVDEAKNGTIDVINNLPDYLQQILNLFHITNKNLINQVGSVDDTNFVQSMNDVICSAVVPCLSFVFLIVLFILLFVIFKVIISKTRIIFRLPVIKQINGILGGALGLAEGLLICFAGVFICSVMLSVNPDFIVSQEMIAHSYIFKAMYNTNIVQTIVTAFTNS